MITIIRLCLTFLLMSLVFWGSTGFLEKTKYENTKLHSILVILNAISIVLFAITGIIVAIYHIWI